MKQSYFLRILPVLIWALVIFLFSANTNPYQLLPKSWSKAANPTAISKAEKLGRFLHTGEYVVLSVLVARTIIWKRRAKLGLVLIAWGLTALYALSDEIHQFYVPGRTFQLSDLILDFAGAVIGIAVYLLVSLWLRNSHT